MPRDQEEYSLVATKTAIAHRPLYVASETGGLDQPRG